MPIHLLFHHFFLPHHSNNHRPKILHHKSLFALIILITILSAFTVTLRHTTPQILGVATDITIEQLLYHVNEKRQKEGMSPLSLDPKLTEAAKAKAEDMFLKDYWAHNSPEGITPWVFIQKASYDYVYAGENLAKDFNDSRGVVDAWMASPTHRENMLSPKYREIGFAVVNGKLKGEETTLVVEMFGATAAPPVPKVVPLAQNTGARKSLVDLSVSAGVTQAVPLGITTRPLINSMSLTKRIAIFLLTIVFAAFLLDLIYVKRQKLMRLIGHNTDHLLFLAGAVFLILLFGRGVVQ